MCNQLNAVSHAVGIETTKVVYLLSLCKEKFDTMFSGTVRTCLITKVVSQ